MVFLPFDFYARHREELGLNEAQARELERIGEDLRKAAQKFEEDRRAHTTSLEKLMEQTPINVEEAMKRKINDGTEKQVPPNALRD